MAEKNLRNIKDDYPLLSCHNLFKCHQKKLDQTLPRSGLGKGYLPDESSPQEECLPSVLDGMLHALREQHAARNRDLVQAEWNPEKKRVFVTRRKGKCMQNVGEIIHGKTVLYPEEALFLMETSVLELLYNGAVQSIQEAYQLLLGEDMALEKFQVYSYLRRLGYIVVRHKKRSDNLSKTECERHAESIHDRPLRKDIHLRDRLSHEQRKHSSENKYNANDCVNEKICRYKESTDIESMSKTNSRVRCLWQGIDIPNIAGKTFLELHLPSLSLFPKNVCPQKQHYIIDLQASKNEVDYYYNYYEDDTSNNNNTKNQACLTESQTYNSYSDYNAYNLEVNKNLNADQYVRQDACHTTSDSDQPMRNYENATLGSYLSNAGEQTQSYNTDPHQSQGYVHNVHDNWNTIPHSNYGNINNSSHAEHRKQKHSMYNMDNSHPYETDRNYAHNNNCTSNVLDNNNQHCYVRNNNNLEPGQFQNTTQGYSTSIANELCHGTADNDNANVASSVILPGEKSNVNYEMRDSNYTYNSSSDQYGKPYKDDKNYGQGTSESVNFTERLHKSYVESKEDSAYAEESLKQNTYKQQYVKRRNKSFNKKYTNKNKRRKGRQNTEEENSSPFPRVAKVVSGWKEFKHEAELQSTAEYLMNGPAKVLWNNKITPLVAPSEHLTKESVFGALSIINNMDDAESCISQPAPYGKLDFDVYMPTTNYSRYDTALPSHSIKVVRCKDPTPSIGCEGKVPVHYAMVDNGSIVFYSFRNVELPCYV